MALPGKSSFGTVYPKEAPTPSCAHPPPGVGYSLPESDQFHIQGCHVGVHGAHVWLCIGQVVMVSYRYS